MALSRRQFLQACGLGVMSVATAGSLVGCGGSGSDGGSAAAGGSSNATKPVVFYNRQPSNSSTGELDMTTLKWNDDTYYVGFDAKQGGELEGQMVVEYIKAMQPTSTATVTASLATSSPSVTWDTTTPSLVPVAAVRPWAPLSRRTADRFRPRRHQYGRQVRQGQGRRDRGRRQEVQDP